MKQEQREEVARFRFGVISDLVGAIRLEPGEMAELIKRKSKQRYNIPYSNRTRCCVRSSRSGRSRVQQFDT